MATDGTRRETWAYGLRNPWRFAFDPVTGKIWLADVGQNAREEIDVIEKGKNYGWNVMEGTSCFKPAADCDQTGLTPPIYDFARSGGVCSVTGGFVYRGKAIPELNGWYIYSDFCAGIVSALRTDQEKPQPEMLLALGPDVSSFGTDLDGELYLISFDGKLYKMQPG